MRSALCAGTGADCGWQWGEDAPVRVRDLTHGWVL